MQRSISRLGLVAVALSLAGLASAEKAKKPTPHELMAQKVVAAVAAEDHAAILALMSKQGRTELADISTRSFRTLRKALKTEGIDLKRAKILRVEPAPGFGIQMVDIYLSFEGREFQMHFSAMTLGGKYDLMGVAQWIKWTRTKP